jgi:hypothetical protein
MNASDLTDTALDALLRAGAPEPLVDAGFVARTMGAVDRVARNVPAPCRPTPVAPIDIARALVAEARRHDAQARLWRWAMAGAGAGIALLVTALAAAPVDAAFDISELPRWYPLWATLAAGALWYAWQEFRAA